MNKEAEIIARGQVELYGRISRAYENLRKTSSTKLTLGIVEARLLSLEANWAKFEAQHDKLLALPREALAGHDYRLQDIPELAEEAFLSQKGMFLDVIRSLKEKENTAASTTKSETASTPRSTLPRIQLPHFSGKYEDWPAFRDLFQSIIGRDASTSSVERMHYLKTCLKGEAELLIRDVATTGENYERAWKTLSAYYENKRLLTRAYLANFISLQKMKSESAVELRKIFHGIKATVSSLDGIDRSITRCEDLFVYLAVDLLDPRSRREWETSISDTTEPPSYATLEQFLDRRLHTLESMQPAKADSAAKTGNGAAKSTRSHLARKDAKPDSRRNRCALCQKDHFLMLCEDYKKKTAAERKQLIDSKGLCFNCLGRHQVSECSSKKDCTACGARHHTSLHDACREIEAAKTSHVAQPASNRQISVLLATARVRVADRHGIWRSARALVDQGSESSMISERLAQRLKLRRSPVSVAVYGVGGQQTGVARGRTLLTLSSRSGGAPMSVSALILPRLTVYAGGILAGAGTWPHLDGLDLADPDYGADDPVDILLGADIYASILCQGLRKGGSHEPVAQKTELGWILSGAIDGSATGHIVNTHQCRTQDLTGLVRRFWEQEEIPTTSTVLTKAEQECEDHFARTHSRRPDGRYVVRLPVIRPLPDLTGTRCVAERVLKHMDTRFARDSVFEKMYSEFMRQYADLGHMTRISPAVGAARASVCFLPHHGVRRETSSTPKLRVVFNGSAKVPSGETLNQHLHIGPNLLPALADILLQWRQHRYVFATDIEKMYRQVDVHPLDRDLQRVLWRESASQEVREYQLNTITYGMACAPFLALRTLRQLIDDEGHNMPLGAAVLRRDVYMDDILSGAATIEEALEVRRQVERLCRAGGFPSKKGSSNDASLLDDVPPEDRLLRVTAWCLCWVARLRERRSGSKSDEGQAVRRFLLASDVEDARWRWIQIIQSLYFRKELAGIKGNKPLSSGALTKLNPFLDSKGILRVGGRLKHALLPHDGKHPAILPGASHLTKLVIDACHRRTLHGGVQLTLGAIRQEYWLPRGRALVKAHIHRCLTCLRWRAASPQPMMGNLPASRVTPARPFLNTGVDYAGPVWLRTSGGRGQKASKAFLVVFVCLSSRAVHLDVASDYSADAFLAALHRFVARRGLCRALYSDCGTNFVGADAQLRALFSASSREGRQIAARLSEDRIQWHFNPPAAPNFGGIWEAAVKSMKHHLRRVIGDSRLTYEEMATLLAQVEACLNSRPLQALTDDPEDLAALTPGHFLVGAPLNAVPEPSLIDEPTTRLSRWKLLQQMRDHFWDRWSREYLHSIAHRPKWTKADEEVRVGRLCLLRSEISPPNKWPLARVEQLHPGDDGHTRVVGIRTATSRFTRPVSRLVLLPVSAEDT